MRGKRFSEEKIIGVLKEANAGVPIADLSRKHGISDKTIYNWKARCVGLEINAVKRLRTLEEENRRLEQIVANQTRDIHALKSVVSKNF